MDTDHRKICKFSNASDPGYMRVMNEIVKLVRDAPDAIRRKFEEAGILFLLRYSSHMH